jgi:hypothetical protein
LEYLADSLGLTTLGFFSATTGVLMTGVLVLDDDMLIY